jgi:hypothetical protein
VPVGDNRATHVPLTQVELNKLEVDGTFDNVEDIDRHIRHLHRLRALVIYLRKLTQLHRDYPHFISVREYFKIHSLIGQLSALVAQTQEPDFYRSS